MKFRTLAALFGCALLIVVGCGKGSESGGEDGVATSSSDTQASILPGEALCTVDGTEINQADIDREVARLFERLGGGQISPFQAEAMKEQLLQQAMERLIAHVLLYDAVKTQQITVSDETLAERHAEYVAQFPNEETYLGQLASMGMTEESLKEEMAKSLQIEELLKNNIGELEEATPAVCREYYETNAERFIQGEEVQASHILLTVDANTTDEERAAIKEKIEGIRKQCVDGADFAELARAESKCPSSANGGDLGWFGSGRMVKKFEEVAFRLQPGEISEVVETEFGYHVIRIADRRDEKKIPLADVEEQIAFQLTGERRSEAVEAYIRKLKESAEIRFMDS